MHRNSAILPEQFTTLGELLKYLRRRVGLTQRELAIAVGYSDTQISRIEQNQRVPDQVTLTAQFVPALDLEHEPVWVARLIELAIEAQRGKTSAPHSKVSLTPAQDWGEAPYITVFYGRQAELAELKRWLIDDHCRLVAVLGMGGVGKTALAAKLTYELAAQFEGVIWRSLLNAPPLAEILRGWLQLLSAQQLTDLPATLTERLTLLVDYLRRQHCLLVLDNVEGILQGGDRAGYYRPGYEDYGQLIQRIGAADHQGCLLLTSRERPREFARLERDTTLVRSLPLAGLGAEAGQEILKARRLSGSAEAEAVLVERYSGNPLAANRQQII